VVQQLEICFTTLARWWIIPKSAAVLIVSERAEIWGNLCICSNCKTCTFYLYCFLHILLSRELWIHWKCTIFFYLADELLSPTRFQLYIIFHLGPKTADRISIFTLTLFLFLPFSLLYSNTNCQFIIYFSVLKVLRIFTGQKYFPQQQNCKII